VLAGVSAIGSFSELREVPVGQSLFEKVRRNSLFSGTATYLLSNILNAAVPFALLPIMTRYLTTSQYGEIAMFQTLLPVMGSIAGISVVGAASRKYYDFTLVLEEHKFFIGACFQILAVSGITSILIIVIFHGLLSKWTGLQSQWIVAACCSAVVAFAIQMRMGQWQVQKKAFNYGVMQVTQSVVNICLSLILVVFFILGAPGRMLAQLITSIIFSGIALTSLYKDKLLGFAWRPRYIDEALRFGVPLIPHSVGLLVLSLFDRFLINTKLGLAEVGIYMVAVQLTSAMGLVFDAINNAYVPWLFERLKRDNANEKQEIVRLTYWYFLIALSMAGVAFLVGPVAIRMIAGDRYAAAGQVIGWLALGQAFIGMYLMVTNYVFFSMKTGHLAMITFGSGLLNVALLFLMVSRWGIVGAAMASTLAMAARFLLTWYEAQQRHPMPWFNFNFV